MNKSLIVIAAPGNAALNLYDLDDATMRLSERARVSLPVQGFAAGTPLAVNSDQSRLYLSWRGERNLLLSFAVDAAAGALEFLGEANLPASMCYVAVASCGARILTASFPDSTIAISPIGADGRAGEPIMVQDCPHAHCIVEAPNGYVYTTSLRGDVIRVHAFNAGRTNLELVAEIATPPGTGPRHLVFTRDGRIAYLLSEFSASLTSFAVDPESGLLAPLHSVNMLTDHPKPWGAELRLSADERILYASERRTSQLFSYRLGEDGSFSLVGRIDAPECPRAFTLAADDAALVVLGEKDGQAQVVRTDASGALLAGQALPVGDRPSWALSLRL